MQELPPMCLATSGRRASYEEAARRDLGIVTNLMNQTVEQLAANIRHYRRLRAESGLDPDAGRVTVLLHTHLAEDHAAARAAAREPMSRYLRSSLQMRSAASALGAAPRTWPTRARPTSPTSSTVPTTATATNGPHRLAGHLRGHRRRAVGRGRRRDRRPGRLRSAAGGDEGGPGAAGRPAPPLPRAPTQPKKPKTPEERRAPATPAQRRLWLAATLIANPAAYNEIQSVRLRGPLDVEALRTAVDGLVRRHDGLRTAFVAGGDGVFQVVLEDRDRACPALIVDDVRGRDADEVIRAALREESARAYDLAVGPLFTPWLLRLADDDHALILGMHHLVTDGHSRAGRRRPRGVLPGGGEDARPASSGPPGARSTRSW
ncbi:LLM class flavin-dependent oxidoreductase [Streptomyces mirabilis]|nr:LLM class flavin-dependent oxidoreductase [Streptomyces mirabilis]